MSNFLRALHFLDSPWFHQNTFDLFFPRSISDYRAGYPTAIPTADYILFHYNHTIADVKNDSCGFRNGSENLLDIFISFQMAREPDIFFPG